MSTARMGRPVRRTDPTRTPEAKARTKALHAARAAKRPLPLDVEALDLRPVHEGTPVRTGLYA